MEINKEREAFEKAMKSRAILDLDYVQYHEISNKYVIQNGLKGEYFKTALDCSHVVNVAWMMWQEKATPEGFVLLPIEPSEAIKTALSYQCFDFIKVAQVYRNLGFDIPKKAEDEQSFFLHKFLILAIKHGNDFIKVFNAETKAMVDVKGLNS